MNATHFKRSIALILMLVMMGSMSAAAQMETYPFVAYTSDITPLMQDASPAAAKNGDISALSGVSVTGEEGDYYIVLYEGKTGYVLKTALSLSLPEKPAVPTPLLPDAAAAAQYPALQKGDTGDRVVSLQQALIELGFLRGKADGKYGPATEKAVSAFQQKNALPVNGRADSAAQQMLFEKTVLNARGKKTAAKTVPSGTVENTKLKLNDRGLPVQRLQQALKDLGYYKGGVDGTYGRATRAAVQAFQKANRLKADGVAGELTLSVLYSGSALSKNATPAPSAPVSTAAPSTSPAPGAAAGDSQDAPATYPYETATLNSVNLRKTASTRSMRILTVPSGATVTVLKDAGTFVQVAYREYTGYVLKEYVDIPERYLSGKSFTTDTAARVKYETLAIGASGDKVKALQQALKELGFYNGQEDGVFESETQQAVRRFQEKNGYKATGIALPEMQKLVYEGKPRNARNRLVKVSVLAPIENPDMKLGDRGASVESLQRTLTALGFYADVIDGTYGKSTEKAVRAYQKAHSIRETGKMDSFTWLSVNAAAKTTPAPSGSADTVTEANVIVMRRGTRGLAVTRLQERLVALGYYAKVPNGVYEAEDVDAVTAFQRSNGITSSGTADLVTQQALFSASAVPASKAPPADWQSLATPSPAPATPAPQYGTLKVGSSGEQVRALQSRLVTLKYLTGNADGIYGTQTAQAVTAFQKANGLVADGVAGVGTLTRLYAADANANTAASNTPTSEGGLTRTLSVGMSGPDVADAQRRLIALKYLEGAADGVFGPKTALAVQAFQSRNSLKADGQIGSLTWAKLNSSAAIANGALPGGALPSPQPTPTPTPGASGGGSVFAAPRASEVRNANWYSEVKSRIQAMPNVTVYDFMSGKHYNVKVFSSGKHADGEPVTADDTATMRSALGTENWTPRPVWVIFSDGRVYMASTHSRGHEVDHNPHNNLTGHICIHFPREMEEAQATGPYAVSHQNAILAGWDLTQQMAK